MFSVLKNKEITLLIPSCESPYTHKMPSIQKQQAQQPLKFKIIKMEFMQQYHGYEHYSDIPGIPTTMKRPTSTNSSINSSGNGKPVMLLIVPLSIKGTTCSLNGTESISMIRDA